MERHSKGGVCLLIEDILFTGDTLFKGLIGRVDLPGGDEKSLHNSLKIISKLKTSTVIYPGHGSSSTIGNELNNNEKVDEIASLMSGNKITQKSKARAKEILKVY